MAAISTHLHDKPYLVATTTKPDLIHRKWNHLGTLQAPSHRAAAYAAYKETGDIVGQSNNVHGVVYLFSCGLSICVSL